WVRDPGRSAGEVTIIVLDEVDKLKGDEVLYNLSRINSDLERNKVSVIGISNDLKFTEFLDPRVKSSLGEESMIFAPYDAKQLELDRISEVVRTLPTQSKLVLLATIQGEESNRDQGVHTLTTGEVFDVYKELCQRTGSDVLTQRRITDLISELDMLGIFTARV